MMTIDFLPLSWQSLIALLASSISIAPVLLSLFSRPSFLQSSFRLHNKTPLNIEHDSACMPEYMLALFRASI
jgi:hypothetical protein